MGTGVDLLKLLEPTVRPGGLPGPARTGGSGPIETRSFESLLSEASGGESSDAGTGDGGAVQGVGAKPQAAGNPLQALTQVDRVENSSLRKLMGGE